MEKELFFLFNPDNPATPKKPLYSFRASQPSTAVMPEKLLLYLKFRNRCKYS